MVELVSYHVGAVSSFLITNMADTVATQMKGDMRARIVARNRACCCPSASS